MVVPLQFLVQLVRDGVVARLGRNLGDARPHQSAAHYSDFSDVHVFLLEVQKCVR